MIHISKTKKGNFIVANIGKNGEILKSSEPLESKANCWKNIKAELTSCYLTHTGDEPPVAVVQDNTLNQLPTVYLVGKKRVVANGIKPQTPHIPK